MAAKVSEGEHRHSGAAASGRNDIGQQVGGVVQIMPGLAYIEFRNRPDEFGAIQERPLAAGVVAREQGEWRGRLEGGDAAGLPVVAEQADAAGIEPRNLVEAADDQALMDIEVSRTAIEGKIVRVSIRRRAGAKARGKIDGFPQRVSTS